ncbi:hypothetical protein HZU77_006910 [Neisseriaceae bacterium TC5R-5]|nr:hypothetical protein [Neisseriaceae bacterium TC5R-5]
MSGLLRYWRVGVGLLLVLAWLASLSLAWHQSAEQVRREWALADSQRQAKQAQTDLTAYQQETTRLHDLSAQLETQLTQLRHTQPKLIEAYNHVTQAQPLHPDCPPGTERLRQLNAAIDAANTIAAGQPAPSQPGNSPPEPR